MHFINSKSLKLTLYTLGVFIAFEAHSNNLDYERVNYSTASNEQQSEDMRVKVMGGYVTASRLYRQVKLTSAQANDSSINIGVSGALGSYAGSNSERESLFTIGAGNDRDPSSTRSSRSVSKNDFGVWIFNPEWYDLVFLDKDLNRIVGSNSEGTRNTAFNIDRNDFIYKRKAQGAYFEYQHNGANLRITPTESGYRWSNRQGDYIDYDQNGRVTKYGDKNLVEVSLERNAAGLIRNVRDHFGNVVLSWTYDGVRPIKVEDYTGRQVSYKWNGRDLVEVTTVRGHDWRYEYDSISGNRVLVATVDPEGQRFEYRYKMSRAGFVTTRGAASAPAPPVIGDDDVVVSRGGGRSGSTSGGGGSGSIGGAGASVIAPSMLLYTEKVYPDGKRNRYQYFYNYDTKNYVLVQQDSDGFEHERWFDLDGNLKQALKGGLFAQRRIRDGRRAVETDPYGNKTVTTYSRWEAVESVTFADSTSIKFKYLPNYNFPTLITDEIGVKTRLKYDFNGNPIEIIRGLGLPEQRTLQLEYDEFGNVLVERAVGDDQTTTVEIEHSYDNRGNRVSSKDGNGNVTTYNVYNAIGQLLEMLDARGNIWKASYDEHGNLVSQTTPLGFTSRYSYDGLNRVATETDAELRRTQYEYDSRNNQTKTTNNQGNAIEASFRMDGQLLTRKDESGQTITLQYDRAARVVSETDDSGDKTIYRYERGDELAGTRLQNIILPNNQMFYSYDKRNRQIRLRVASLDNLLADVTNFVYSQRGDRLGTTDGNGILTQYQFNAHREPILMLNAKGETLTTMYDRRGNIVSVIDGKQKTTQYEYDSNNNTVREIRPMGGALTRTFDESDNFVQSIDANGNTSVYEYDKDNRLIGNTNSLPLSGQNERSVAYTYDGTNLLTGYTDNDSAQTFSYDSLGRLTEQLTNFGPFSKTLATSYYLNSQISGRVDAEGLVQSFSYDASGRTRQIFIENEGSITVDNYSGHLPTDLTFPGGTKQSIQYDGLARIQGISVFDSSDQVLLNHQYMRDPVGNILAKSTLQGMSTYEYDNVYRLTEVIAPSESDSQSFRYDQNSNRINKTKSNTQIGYQFNDNHELIRKNDAAQFTSYRYDNNGALVEESSGGAVTSYKYNSFARLASVQYGDVELARYKYDPMGRRISKTINNQTTYFLYDGANLVGEYDQAGELVKGYIYQPDSTEASTPLVSRVAASGDSYLYFYHQNDHLGTPQTLVQKNGLVTWRGDYDAFGKARESKNGATNQIRFPGQYLDNETGLHYNWNRYFDNKTGRYISSDPIGLHGGPNTYLYGYANPNRYIDPTGEIVPALILGAGIGIGFNFLLQMIRNGGNLGCLNYGELFAAGAFGALTGGVGSALGRQALTSGIKNSLSNQTKGRIGNALSRLSNRLRGNRLIGREQRIPGQRSIADSVWRARDGSIYYVESKFGTAGLTAAQRQARGALGASYIVEKWTYPWLGKQGSRLGSGLGGLLGGGAAGAAGGSSCQCGNEAN